MIQAPKLPTQTELLLPLLDVLRENGRMRAKDACDAVAERINLPKEARDYHEEVGPCGQDANLFNRKVRWTRQNAVFAELIDPSVRGLWDLTPTGTKTHITAKAGVAITVYQNALGTVLWSEARAALQYIEKGSVTALISSPPYPLVKARDYEVGSDEWRPENYLDTLLDHLRIIRPLIATDGSVVLNLGPSFVPGKAARNPYQHQLISALVGNMGWDLVDEHYWFSPTKPRCGDHVTRTRTHCVNGMETFYILSPHGQTKCSNLRVLNPYSDRHRKLIAKGGEVVTSNSPSMIQTVGVRHKRDNGGSIPTNLHVVTPDADRAYRAYCKERGLLAHSAMMPTKLCEFFIELTTEPGDLVVDPFGGSLKTFEAALRLDRRCIASERCLDTLIGAAVRLPERRMVA